MTTKQIDTFLADYNLGSATDVEQLPATTSGNTSYIVHINSAQYVIRTLVRQTKDSAEDERIIQQQANAAGIFTPLYLTTRSGTVTSTLNNDVDAVISRRIEGSRQSEDTLGLARSMGEMLARLHTTLRNVLVRPNEQQWFNATNAHTQLERYAGIDKEFIAEKTNSYATIFSKNLPMTMTHGDFHTKNVFSSNDSVTAVFDFESAEYTVRILDIARLYLTYRKATTLPSDTILHAIIDGYDSAAIQSLTDLELGELNNAFIYVALISSVSIYNHGNSSSSEKYIQIAKALEATPLTYRR